MSHSPRHRKLRRQQALPTTMATRARQWRRSNLTPPRKARVSLYRASPTSRPVRSSSTICPNFSQRSTIRSPMLRSSRPSQRPRLFSSSPAANCPCLWRRLRMLRPRRKSIMRLAATRTRTSTLSSTSASISSVLLELLLPLLPQTRLLLVPRLDLLLSYLLLLRRPLLLRLRLLLRLLSLLRPLFLRLLFILRALLPLRLLFLLRLPLLLGSPLPLRNLLPRLTLLSPFLPSRLLSHLLRIRLSRFNSLLLLFPPMALTSQVPITNPSLEVRGRG